MPFLMCNEEDIFLFNFLKLKWPMVSKDVP